MARDVVGGVVSLVEAGVTVRISARVEAATILLGTDVAGFVAGVETTVTHGFVGLGASIVRTGTDVGAVGTPVALGTGDMVVGAVVAATRSGVSVVIWPEASVAVSSSMASDFTGSLVPKGSGVGAGPEQARRPIKTAMVATTNVFLNLSYSFFSDNYSIAPLVPDSPLFMRK